MTDTMRALGPGHFCPSWGPFGSGAPRGLADVYPGLEALTASPVQLCFLPCAVIPSMSFECLPPSREELPGALKP